jgi:Lyase
MHAFNQSLKYDQRMHAADIRGSIAYAKALALVGILTEDEEAKITEGLNVVGQEWETGVVRLICSSIFIRISSGRSRFANCSKAFADPLLPGLYN